MTTDHWKRRRCRRRCLRRVEHHRCWTCCPASSTLAPRGRHSRACTAPDLPMISVSVEPTAGKRTRRAQCRTVDIFQAGRLRHLDRLYQSLLSFVKGLVPRYREDEGGCELISNRRCAPVSSRTGVKLVAQGRTDGRRFWRLRAVIRAACDLHRERDRP